MSHHIRRTDLNKTQRSWCGEWFSRFWVKCAVYLNAKPREHGGDPSCSACWLTVDGMGHLYGRHFDDLLLLESAKIRPQSKSAWLERVSQAMGAKKTLIRQCGVLSRPSLDIQRCEEGCCTNNSFDQFILHTFRRHDSTQGPNQIRRSPASDAVQPQSVCTPSIGPTTTNCQMYQVGDQVAACRRGAGLTSPNIRRALRREPRYHLVGNDYRCKSLINSKPAP